jgi:hypothetical protein
MNLTAGATLRLRVEAYNAADVATSADFLYQVPVNALTAPKLTQGTKTATSVILNWTNNNSATGFRIYQITGTKRRILATAGETATTLTVKGLNPGTTVKFQVEAFYRGRNALSNTITVTLPPLVLTKPVVEKVYDPEHSDIVTLKWGSIEAAQGYRLYRVQGTKRTLMKSLPASATSHKLAGFPSGSKFIVQAYRGIKTVNSSVVII